MRDLNYKIFFGLIVGAFCLLFTMKALAAPWDNIHDIYNRWKESERPSLTQKKASQLAGRLFEAHIAAHAAQTCSRFKKTCSKKVYEEMIDQWILDQALIGEDSESLFDLQNSNKLPDRIPASLVDECVEKKVNRYNVFSQWNINCSRICPSNSTIIFPNDATLIDDSPEYEGILPFQQVMSCVRTPGGYDVVASCSEATTGGMIGLDLDEEEHPKEPELGEAIVVHYFSPLINYCADGELFLAISLGYISWDNHTPGCQFNIWANYFPNYSEGHTVGPTNFSPDTCTEINWKDGETRKLCLVKFGSENVTKDYGCLLEFEIKE